MVTQPTALARMTFAGDVLVLSIAIVRNRLQASLVFRRDHDLDL
jgi:hypothetical protein